MVVYVVDTKFKVQVYQLGQISSAFAHFACGLLFTVVLRAIIR